MDFTLSAESADLQQRTCRFIEEQVVPMASNAHSFRVHEGGGKTHRRSLIRHALKTLRP